MTDFVTIIEHGFGDTDKKGPKVQIDMDSIVLESDLSFNKGVNFQVAATIKRIGIDGLERIERRVTKDWLAIALAWQNKGMNARRKISV